MGAARCTANPGCVFWQDSSSGAVKYAGGACLDGNVLVTLSNNDSHRRRHIVGVLKAVIDSPQRILHLQRIRALPSDVTATQPIPQSYLT